MRLICLLLSIFALVNSQTSGKEGDVCMIDKTNLSGTCVIQDKCKSAKDEYVHLGIRPTFCDYAKSKVCCKDGGVTDNVAKPDERPIWGIENGTRRISIRKCEEYSSKVEYLHTYIALMTDPEVQTIKSANCKYGGVELIVGGEDALKGEFPHMAAIGWLDSDERHVFLCSGSLISPQFVLTAGHCLKFHDSNHKVLKPEPVVVRLGEHNIDPRVNDGANPIDVPIRRQHSHPDYESPSVYNDIALLELAKTVTFRTDIRPACLWTKEDFGEHEKAIATGWGTTNTDSNNRITATVLQKVSLSLLNSDYCDLLLLSIQNRFFKGFSSTQICAGDLREGKDTCQGDSGSPLQVSPKENPCIYYVIGITSIGRKCAETGRPSMYTRVSAYLDWIENIVWPNQ